MNQYLAELKDAGVIGRESIYSGAENLNPNVFKQSMSAKELIKNKQVGTITKNILNSPKKFQQASEETAKLNVYSHFRSQGMSVMQAAKKAEEAIFSPYNISKAEKGLVKGAVPFYSFTRQALPFTAKTALNNGGRLTKYEKTKTAVEGLSPEGTGSKRPAEGTVRLPFKDKNGQYIYADPTYVLPYGNFDSSGGGQLPFGMGVNPLISEAANQMFNKDLYFNQPIAKSNVPARANAQRGVHAYQTFAPNIMPTDFVGGIPTGQPGVNLKTRGGSKLYDAFTNQPDYAGRTRSKAQAILDTLGLKSSSVSPDQGKFDASAKAQALKSIRSEYMSTARDKRLSPAQKQVIFKQLRDKQIEVLRN